MNVTLDDDVLSDSIDDSSFQNEITLHDWILRYFAIGGLIIRILISILALASDIYLIVVIRKFKNLQNRVNNFILQYAIFNLLHLVLVQLLHALLRLFIEYYLEIYCIVGNLDHLLITLCFYVLTFMAVDWYIMYYHSNIYDRFPKTFKYGAYILYLLAIPKWITTSTICFVNHWEQVKIRVHFEAASYLICFITLIIISIVRRRKAVPSEAHNTEYAFVIPRTVLLLYLVPYIVKILDLLIERSNEFDLVQFYMDILILVAPVVVLYKLSKINKYFKSAYLKSCKKRLVKTYRDENLDAESVNGVPPSNVTFDRNSVNISA